MSAVGSVFTRTSQILASTGGLGASSTQAAKGQGIAFSSFLGKEEVHRQSVPLSAPAVERQTAAETFMAFQRQTPAEKMYEQMLAAKGLTKEDVAAMTPEEREKLNKEIAALIREKIERGTGAAATAAPSVES